MRVDHNVDNVSGRSDFSFKPTNFCDTEEEFSDSVAMLIK